MTMRWPNPLFCFLLAMTMVNVQNAAPCFLKKAKIGQFACMTSYC